MGLAQAKWGINFTLRGIAGVIFASMIKEQLSSPIFQVLKRISTPSFPFITLNDG